MNLIGNSLRQISKKSDEVEEPSDAKIILGHMLAVCKYLERIIDVKKLTQGSSSRKRSTGSLANSLQKELTSELRTFSERLEQTQGILAN